MGYTRDAIMKTQKSLLLFFIFTLVFCGCATNKESGEDSTYRFMGEERRIFEEAGGYSIIPPELWVVTDVSGYQNKVFIGQRKNNFTPNISFLLQKFDGELSEYINYFLNDLDKLNYVLIQQSDFVTQKKLYGERIIITIPNIVVPEQHIREVVYFFHGKNNIKIAIVCAVLSEYDDAYDALFDRTVETFEWIDNSLMNNERRFIDKLGGFSMLPPEPWQEREEQALNHKILLLERGEHTTYMNFYSAEFSGNLNESVDVFLDGINGAFEDLVLLKRDDFVTLKKTKGSKMIVTGKQNGPYVRFDYYFIPNDKKLLLITWITPAEAGDTFDALIDTTMETFEFIK